MKQDLYQIERFTPDQLLKMQQAILDYAKAIDGLPVHHSEVYQKRGWLLPFLFAYDDLLWGRWSYWHQILEKQTIEGSGPIPQIHWADLSSPGVVATYKMLQNCIDDPVLIPYGHQIHYFADWLLWGFAHSDVCSINHIPSEVNEHFYRVFDLFLVLNYPTDYMSRLLSEQTGKGYKDALGYFPTPFNVCLAMAAMLYSDANEETKKSTVNDPCIGCGAMLLAASNYTLRGYGQDISQIAVKLAQIQMYWYAPWYAFHPDTISGFSEDYIQLSNNHKQIEGQLMFTL